MDKRSRNILILFGVALLTIIIVEVARPKPINWQSSYTAEDKIPFGSYILYEELKQLPNIQIETVSKNPFDFLKDSTYISNAAYIFINSEINFDKRSFEKLKRFIQNGNSVFIAATHFGGTIKDSLRTETEINYQFTEENVTPSFFSPSLQKDSLPKFKKRIYKSVFKSFDTTNTKVLGYYKNEEEKLNQVNFISMTLGKGTLYLHSLPEAFSNYYLLKNKDNYAATCLSFLNHNIYYWDEYLKDGRKIIDSPMRYVLNQASLRWAYYLLITGLLLFVLTKAKREQRIIPVVKPLENTSIEFTKTIGDLYFQHKDYSNIITKKIMFFLERMRSLYYINTDLLDQNFIEKLAIKSNHSVEETSELIVYITNLQNKNTHTEVDVIELNKKIEKFIR